MDEDVEEKVIESIDKVQSWLDKGGEFAAEQAPLVVNEIIAVGYIENGIGLAAAVFGITVCLLFLWRGWCYFSLTSEFNNGKETLWFLAMLCSGIFGFVFAIMIPASIHGLLFVHFAPRLYVLEELSKLF